MYITPSALYVVALIDGGYKSLEGLGVEVVFLHCAIAVEWLWARKLGRVATKECVVACRHWFESWNTIAIAPIAVAGNYIIELAIQINGECHQNYRQVVQRFLTI